MVLTEKNCTEKGTLESVGDRKMKVKAWSNWYWQEKTEVPE